MQSDAREYDSRCQRSRRDQDRREVRTHRNESLLRRLTQFEIASNSLIGHLADFRAFPEPIENADKELKSAAVLSGDTLVSDPTRIAEDDQPRLLLHAAARVNVGNCPELLPGGPLGSADRHQNSGNPIRNLPPK